MSNFPTAAALIAAANEARDSWIVRAASVGRNETPSAIHFRHANGSYRAEFKSKGKPKIYEIATYAINLRYGNRPETRVV